MVAKGATAVVVKKKRWVKIQAPKLFSEQVIGESYVVDVKDLVGRHVTVSLMVLTGDPQKQSVHVSFKITGINNDMATTEIVGYTLLPSAAKKLMRRNRGKIEDSFMVESADKKVVLIKPLIITRGATSGSVLATMRKLERAYVSKMISKMDTDSIVRDIVQKKLQHGLGQLLRFLYPIGACEIRQFEFIPIEKVKELGLKLLTPPEHLPELRKKEEASEKESASEKEQPAEPEPVSEQSA